MLAWFSLKLTWLHVNYVLDDTTMFSWWLCSLQISKYMIACVEINGNNDCAKLGNLEFTHGKLEFPTTSTWVKPKKWKTSAHVVWHGGLCYPRVFVLGGVPCVEHTCVGKHPHVNPDQRETSRFVPMEL